MISWHKPGLLAKESPSYRWLLLFNVLVTTFMAVLSAVTTIVADSSIRGELALSSRETVWLTTLYLLGVNTVVPAANWFADRFGYKIMYALGVTIFTLASGLAAISTSFEMIAAARLVEGIGGGFIFPVGLAIIAQNFPKERLSLALILYVAAAFGGGFALGAPISGYLTQFHSWRFIFAFIFPVGLIATFFCWIIHEETERTDFKRFDYWGYICFATFIATLLMALTYGPLPSTNGGWRSPFVIGSFLVAAIAFVSTIYIESRHEDPIIPLVLFKDPVFAVSAVAMFLLGMSIFASVSVSMDYMLNALMYEKFTSSKVAIVYGIAIAVCSILSNGLLKVIPAQALTFFGLLLLIVSYFANKSFSWLTGADQVFWILLMRGMGVGFALGPTTLLALQKVPEELRSKAATLLTFFRQVGGTYGGTLIAILVIKRKIFHLARFSEQVNTSLSGYKVTFKKLFDQYYTDFSTNGVLESVGHAKGAIARNLELQAFITAQNDALFIFGCVTSVVAFILLSLNLYEWWIHRKPSNSPNQTPPTSQ